MGKIKILIGLFLLLFVQLNLHAVAISSAGSGNWSSTTTWVGGVVPGAADAVTIVAGHTVTIDGADTCKTLTINGALIFEATTAYKLGVSSTITINSTGTLSSALTGTQIGHMLHAGGNITNYGTLDLSTNGNTAGVTLVFTNTGSIQTLSGTGSVTDIMAITLNKGSSSNSATISSSNFTVRGSSTDNSGFLTYGTGGILTLSGSYTMSSVVFTSANYTIPSTGGFSLGNANFTIIAQNGNASLAGPLTVSAGVYNIGTAADNSLIYGNASSTVALTISGGTLNVSGRICPLSLGTSKLNYTQSGGTVNVVTIGNSSTTLAGLDLNSGQLSTSGGTTVIHNSCPSGFEYRGPTTTGMSGGTFQFGGIYSSSSGQTFRVNGGTIASIICYASINPNITLLAALTVKGDVLTSGTCNFNLNGYTLTMSGISATNPGNFTIGTSSTFTANISTNNGITFNSSLGNQSLINNGSITDFYGTITINNAYSNGSGTVTLPSLNITNSGTNTSNITLTKGILVSSGLFIGNNNTSNVTITKTDGSFQNTPTFNFSSTGLLNINYNSSNNPQTIGNEFPASNTINGTITINNAYGVTSSTSLTAGGLVLTSGILTVPTLTLSLTTGGAIALITGGSTSSYIKGALARTFTANLLTGSTKYDFPVGKDYYHNYSLSSIRTGTTGPVISVEAFDANCGGIAGSGINNLFQSPYWNSSVVSGNFTSATVGLTCQGIQSTTLVGKSSTQNGAYADIGGTYTRSNPSISSNVVLTTLGYFALGTSSAQLSGNYHIGSGKTYLTITSALSDLVLKGISSSVVFYLDDVSYSEQLTFSAYIGANSSNNVTFKPNTGTIVTISSSSAPVINFSGGNYYIIDGSNSVGGTTKDLTIDCSSTASTTGTSTVKFSNGSSNNIIKYCVIKGSEMAATGTNGGGVVFFGTLGNNNNTIDNNDITSSSDVNRPINAVFSYGTSGNLNSGNIISNNNIYNFLNRGSASNGVYLDAYSTSFSITGNSFYETSSFIPTASVAYNVIYINNTSGTNFTVSNNYIGGNSSNCGGTWSKTNAFSNSFTGIYISVGTGISSSIQGNVIKNISHSDAGTTADWFGINIVAGNVNVGTTTGNTIGAVSGNGSITFNAGANGSNFYGMKLSGTLNVQNNNVGAITIANSNSANPTHFYGIATSNASAYVVISNNTIGSVDASTTNSINQTSQSTGALQYLIGINIPSSTLATGTISGNTISKLTNGSTHSGSYLNGVRFVNGPFSVTNNTIRDLNISNANTSATNSISVCGILQAYDNITGGVSNTITGNTIYTLCNNYSSVAATSVSGIFYAGGLTQGNISGNFVHSLTVNSSNTSSSIYGIKKDVGNTSISNNIVSLAGDTKTTIYGIYETGALNENSYLYFNTVYISGTLASGSTNKSYALYSAVTTNTRDFRNNIFYNSRSTSGGSNLHYGMYIVTSGGTLSCNYNDYVSSGTGSVLGYYGSAKTVLPIVTGQDANSMNTNPQFSVSKGNGTSAADFKPGVSLIGDATTGITSDFTGFTRPSPPTLGSIEKDSPLPVTLQSFTYNISNRDVKLNWATSSEQNNAGFEIQKIGNRQEATGIWEKIGYIIGKGTTNTQTEYNFIDTKVNTGKYKYRLKQIDNNGNFEYHYLNGEVEIGIPSKFELSQNYPNPFNPVTKIDFQLPVDSKVTLKIYDITGREVMTLINSEFRKADYYTVVFNGNNISSGIYFYRLVTNDFVMTKKMMLIK